MPFLVRLLDHLAGIAPILLGGYTTATQRLKRSCTGPYGGSDVFWEHEKITSIRKIGASRFELRPLGCLKNPYLQAASLIRPPISCYA